MQKSTTLLVSSSAIAALALTGCTHNIPAYSTSYNNVMQAKAIKGTHPIALGQFIDPKNTLSIACRAEGTEKLPGGMSYVGYIKNAMQNELHASGLYNPNSKTKLDATLTKIDFTSSIGHGKWFIGMQFNDHKQAPYRIYSTYDFSTNFVADVACQEVATAFPEAVEQFLRTVYASPKFKRTLTGR